MTASTLRFADLASMDPAIGALEKLTKRAAAAAGGDPDYLVFYTEVNPLVTALAGWHRGDSSNRLDNANIVDQILRTGAAYDTVYQHLADVIRGLGE